MEYSTETTEINTEKKNLSKKEKKTSSKTSKTKKSDKKDIDVEENHIEEDVIEENVNKNDIMIEENIVIESDSENNTLISLNNENTSEIPIYPSKEEYLEKQNNLLEIFQWFENHSINDYQLTKDFIKQSESNDTKIIKAYASFLISKNKESYKNLNNISKKESKKDKKKVPNSNHPQNILRETFDEVLEFMNLPHGTLLSKSDVMRGINDYINKNNLRDSKKFKLDEKLKKFIEFLEEKIIKNGKSFEKYKEYKITNILDGASILTLSHNSVKE